MNRSKKLKKQIDELAQGQIFSGRQAKNLGLVDELSSLWEAARSIHEELKSEKEFGLKFIKLKKNFQWEELFENIEGKLINLGSRFGRLPMLMVKMN